jgi:transcriptional regulator with XRE-family HTH domain
MTGEEMKMIRKLLGMTQKQFGSDLGIPNPQVQIASMETGRRTISKRLSKSIQLLVGNVTQKKTMEKNGIKEAA